MDIYEFLKKEKEEKRKQKEQITPPAGKNIYQIALDSHAKKLNDYEAIFTDLDHSITTDYDRYVDLGRQLDDLQLKMQQAPQELQFNLSVKYENIRNEHNKLVDKLKADTERQKQVYTDYTQARQEYERDFLDFQRLIGTEARQERALRRPPQPLTNEEKLLKKFTSGEDVSYFGGVGQDTAKKEFAQTGIGRFLIKGLGTGKAIEKAFPEEVKQIKELKEDVYSALGKEPVTITKGASPLSHPEADEAIAEIQSRITGKTRNEIRNEISELRKQGTNPYLLKEYKDAVNTYQYIHSMDNPKTALDSVVWSAIMGITAGQLIDVGWNLLHTWQYSEMTPKEMSELGRKFGEYKKVFQEGGVPEGVTDPAQAFSAIEKNMMPGDIMTAGEKEVVIDAFNTFSREGELLINPMVLRKVFLPSQILSGQAGFLRLPELAQKISEAGAITPELQKDLSGLAMADKIQVLSKLNEINASMASALATDIVSMVKPPETIEPITKGLEAVPKGIEEVPEVREVEPIIEPTAPTEVQELKEAVKGVGKTVVEPVIAYHGTDAEFEKFDTRQEMRFGSHFGSLETVKNIPKSTDKDIEKFKVMEVELDIKNPIRLPDLKHWEEKKIVEELTKKGISVPQRKSQWGGTYYTYDDIINTLQKHGYDGVIYDNKGEGGGDSYIVFEPEQVKVLSIKPLTELEQEKADVKRATPEQIKELEILGKQKKLIVETKQGNISKSRFNRLAKAMTGESNPEKMTPEQVEEFKDAIEQVVQRQPWEPPIIPISTKIVGKDFFEDLQFKEPNIFKFITPKEHLMRTMGVEDLTKPITEAKKIAGMKLQDVNNFIDNTIKEINKNVPVGERIKGWKYNKPTDRVAMFRDLLDKYETAPDYLSEGDKKIFNDLRKFTNDMLERVNEVRERLGLETINKVSAYVPHFLDELARQIVQKKYPFPEDVKYWLGRNMPKKIYNPTEMERRVSQELTDVFSKDLGKLLKVMARYDLRDIYLSEPYSILRAKLNALGDKIPASIRKEIDDYLRYDIFDYPDELDTLFNAIVKVPTDIINFLLKPYGRIITNPAKSLSSIGRRLLISGTIAGRAKLVIRNLFQRLLNMDLYPVGNFLQAQLLPTPKWLKDMIEGSTFWKLSASQGWEDVPKEGVSIEKVALAPYSWSHKSNVYTSMKTGAYYAKEMVDLSNDPNSAFYKYAERFAKEKGIPLEKLLWTEDDILLEAEEAGSLTQWLYYATGMPQIYRGQIKRLFFSLQSWGMNYFTKHVPEMTTRTFTGRTGRGRLIRPADRINALKGLAIISAITYGLKKAGDYAYERYLLPWGILLSANLTSPATQVFAGIFNYLVATTDYQREKAKKQIKDAWKLFIPGSLAYQDFMDWITGKKSLDETLFYKDWKKVQEEVQKQKELEKELMSKKPKTSTPSGTSKPTGTKPTGTKPKKL